MLMWDYSSITLRSGLPFDLFGINYLQRANDWLYYGVGAFAPMVRGNYGGFYGASGILHVQRPISGNWFVNGGLALGAGAGGASVSGIRWLSGDGLYGRAYAGIGYAFRNFSIGLNYTRVAIAGSQINDSTFSLFVQRPLSFSVGNYSDAGLRFSANTPGAPVNENIVSVQFNHATQINPTGLYTGGIGLGSLQFSHFHSPNIYSFFGIDIGVSGLHWYNQAHGGIGARMALSPRLNLYGQIGIGSSGWVTDTINTGPGLIIYPKATLEYLFGNGLGATVSAGYWYAPMGTSRNWTIGVGLNYHMSHQRRATGDVDPNATYTMRGVRLNVFGRMTSPILYRGVTTPGISMLAVQADYALNDRWYLTGQIAAATTRFRSYAGYAEGFVGVGWQRNLTSSGRLQGYAQLMYGLNDVGVSPAYEVGTLIYPAIGFNYAVNERVSVYGQLGATASLGHLMSSSITNRFQNYSLGLGVSYRFSLPTR